MRGMALKAQHLLSGCDNLGMTHHLAGSQLVELLSAGSVMSVLNAVKPCPKGGSSAGSIGGLTRGLTGNFSK